MSKKCCVVFDLQKTLPTPHLNTNKVYYMRQLWTYKLAIRDTSSGHAYMHMWDETQASRRYHLIVDCAFVAARILHFSDILSFLCKYAEVLLVILCSIRCHGITLHDDCYVSWKTD